MALACGPGVGFDGEETATDSTSEASQTVASGPGTTPPLSESSTTEDDTTSTSDGLRPTQLIGSGESFVDAFVGESGIYVVHAWGVQLLSRDGSVLHELPSDRAVESAAFDGEHLVIADQAVLNTLSLDLELLTSAPLIEGCASSVLMSGGRFICGPDNDWDRIFYTYDVESGEMLGTSEPYTYNGIPMRSVPGLDEFVTVSVGTSPSDFHLYTVEDQVAMFINESPYHGDFAARRTYAFWGTPATHLINDEGIMLLIHGASCMSGSSLQSECFIKDGELGTLPLGRRQYTDIREAGPNEVYAVAPDNDDSYTFGSVCGEPSCTIQRIDVDARSVVETTTYISYRNEASLRPDRFSDGVFVIASDRPEDAGDGYDVHYLQQ